jgi:hypothetical protein
MSGLRDSIDRTRGWCYIQHVKQVAASAVRIALMSHKHRLPVWHGRLDRSSRIAHIICPGYSVLRSHRAIDAERSIILGCNLVGLLPLRFDVLTVENANATDYANIQYLCTRDLVAKWGTVIAIKNLWMGNRFTSDGISRYVDMACFLTEAPVYPRQKLTVPQLAEALIKPVCGYYLQYKSSMFLLIALAVANNAKCIVLHGVDFGGRYFWDDPIFANRYVGLPRSTVGAHISDSVGHSTREILAAMAQILERRGVKMYCAADESALSAILPVVPAL